MALLVCATCCRAEEETDEQRINRLKINGAQYDVWKRHDGQLNVI